jgi:hypothetical protein
MPMFTVLILFPEYCSEDFPTDVHIETVPASNAFAATRIVQRNAARRSYVPIRKRDDLQVLAVFEGCPRLELTAQHFRQPA